MPGQDFLQRRVPPIVLWIVAVLVLTLAGQGLQSQVHLNHDVSWFVHFPRWLLQGRTLGADLHDGNLPMVWGVFLPASALAQASLLTEPAAVRLVFWGYFLLSTALSAVMLSRLEPADRSTSAGWLTAFVLVATLAPGFSFGQREHASVLFAMPYLATAVLRLQGGPAPRVSLAILVGVLAGIGFALKPYFLAIPALVELLLLFGLGWRALFVRVESLVLGVTVLAYVVGAVLIIGDYLKFTVGMTMASYWAYKTTNFGYVLGSFVRVAQPALYGGLIALLTRTWSRQHTVMLLAGLGYTVCYFIQSKGFVYHAYPVLVCSVTFLGICLGRGLPRAWAAWQNSRVTVNLAVLSATVLLALPPIKQVHDGVVSWYLTYNIAYGPEGQFRQAVIDVVNHFAPSRNSYFFAFTTHPFPGFPTASYTQADYAGRSIVQQFIPAYARLDEVTDSNIRRGVIRAAEYQRGTVVEDFERRPPSIVFVEAYGPRLGMNGRQFDDVAFYTADPRFKQIWSNYDEYPPLGRLRVFVLRPADAQPGDVASSRAGNRPGAERSETAPPPET